MFRTRSSSVRVHEQCQRKGFQEQVLGLRAPDSIGKTFGTQYHLDWKTWFNDKKLPSQYTDTGIVARRAMHLYPAPGEGLLVEYGEVTEEDREAGVQGAIDEVLADGTIYVGAIDLADVRPAPQLKDGRRLYDHKSTVNMSYAKTADELRRDVSAVFYARRLRDLALKPLGIADRDMPARWVYAERIGKKVQEVDFLITGADMRERWGKTLQSVKEMRALHDQGPRWQDVTPNYNACGDFGGCQFRAQCSLAKIRNNGATAPKESAVGLLDDLKKGVTIGDKVAAPQVQQAKPPTFEPAPRQQGASKATLAARGNSLAALLGKTGPVSLASVQATQPADIEDPNTGLYDGSGDDPEPAEEGLAVGVNPIDAPPPDLSKDTIEKKTRKKREKGAEVTIPSAAAAVLFTQGEMRTLTEQITADVAAAFPAGGAPKVSLVGRIAQLEARIAELEKGGPADTGLANRLAALEAMVGA